MAALAVFLGTGASLTSASILPLPTLYYCQIITISAALLGLLRRSASTVLAPTLDVFFVGAVPIMCMLLGLNATDARAALFLLSIVPLSMWAAGVGGNAAAFSTELRRLGTILIIASFATVALIPLAGLDATFRGAALRGVFVNKNTLGRIAGLVIVITIATPRYAISRIARIATLVPATVALALSRSATPILLIPLAILAVHFSRHFTRRSSLISSTIIAFTGIQWITSLLNRFLFGALGRDASLTGRVPMQLELIRIAKTEPWGFGFGMFWDLSNPTYANLAAQLQWLPPNAHNTLLDAWVELGVIGLVVIAFLTFRLLARARSLAIGREANAPVAALLFYIVFYSVTDSTLSQPGFLIIVGTLSVLLRNERVVQISTQQSPQKNSLSQ